MVCPGTGSSFPYLTTLARSFCPFRSPSFYIFDCAEELFFLSQVFVVVLVYLCHDTFFTVILNTTTMSYFHFMTWGMRRNVSKLDVGRKIPIDIVRAVQHLWVSSIRSLSLRYILCTSPVC